MDFLVIQKSAFGGDSKRDWCKGLAVPLESIFASEGENEAGSLPLEFFERGHYFDAIGDVPCIVTGVPRLVPAQILDEKSGETRPGVAVKLRLGNADGLFHRKALSIPSIELGGMAAGVNGGASVAAAGSPDGEALPTAAGRGASAASGTRGK